MKISKLCLDGHFVEAFLYFDFLWLLTIDGEVWAFDTTAYLAATLGDDAEMPVLAFTRNDELPRGLKDNVLSSFHAELAQKIGPDGLFVSRKEVIAYSRVFTSGGKDAKSILDFRCYYGHGFVATDSCVLQLKMLGRDELKHVHLGGKGNGALRGDRVADFRCRQFRTKFGVVSASAGGDGGFYAAGAISKDNAWRAKFLKFADVSIGAQVMGGTMANVTSEESIDVFATDIHRAETAFAISTMQDEDNSSLEITKILDRRNDATYSVNQEMLRIQKIKNISFKKLYLTASNIYASDASNQLHTVNIINDGEIGVPTFARSMVPAPGHILSLSFTTFGAALAELDESVCVYNMQQKIWQQVFDGETYSVRGYNGSRWYQNLITCVGEDRVELAFLS